MKRLWTFVAGKDPVLARSVIVSMSTRVAGLVLAFAAQLLLSRTLGSQDYGAYAIALSWGLLLAMPARFGLDHVALRFGSTYLDQQDSARFSGLVRTSLALLAALSLAVLAGFFGARMLLPGLFTQLPTSTAVWVAAFIPPMALLVWVASLLQSDHQIVAAQLYEQIVRPALLIVVIVIAVAAGFSWNASAAMKATSIALVAATLLAALHAAVRFRSSLAAAPNFVERREWLGVGWVLFLVTIVREALNQVDTIMLGALSTTQQAAYFAAAARLMQIAAFGFAAVSFVSSGRMASAHGRGDMDALQSIVRFNARASMISALLLGGALILVGSLAVRAFGPGFGAAYPVLIILTLGLIATSAAGPVAPLLMMTGQQRAALSALAGGLAIDVAMNLLLIPRMGAMGAAISSVAGMLFWSAAMVVTAHRNLPIRLWRSRAATQQQA